MTLQFEAWVTSRKSVDPFDRKKNESRKPLLDQNL